MALKKAYNSENLSLKTKNKQDNDLMPGGFKIL